MQLLAVDKFYFEHIKHMRVNTPEHLNSVLASIR